MDFAIPQARKKPSEGDLPADPVAQEDLPQSIPQNPEPPAPVGVPENFPPVTYSPPQWASNPRFEYQLEVLKSGQIIETLDITQKDHLVVGRLPDCDVILEHASISRYHAVLQHSNEGWVYLYDLNSTHGTVVNKARVPAKRFVRLKVGSVIKFGESSRLHILVGPVQFESDVEMATTGEKAEEMARKEAESNNDDSNGISWGMADDAPENDFDSHGAKELDTSEDAWFMKDPKKILKNWLEHHQFDNTIVYEEEKQDHEKVYVARLELPIDTGHGKYAIGTGTKKKEAERECAADACRKLDAAGLLRGEASALEARKKQRMKAMLGDDDSDEDSFYDRTGKGGKKASVAAADKAKKPPQQVETYETLLQKKELLEQEMTDLQQKIQEAEQQLEENQGKEAEDLDDYLNSLKAPKVTLESKFKLEKKHQDLKKELDKLTKLVNIAKPALGSYAKFLPPTPAPTVAKKPAAAQVAPPRPAPQEEVPFKPEEEDEEEPAGGQKPAEPAPVSAAPRGPSSAPTFAPVLPVSQKRKEMEDREEGGGSSESSSSGQAPASTEASKPAAGEKKRKVYGAMTKERFDELTGGEEAVAWEPPKNQTGDGKTSLNEKFGY